MRIGLDAALQARRMIDVDNPTIEGLQSLLLLSQAFFAYGLGKKAYMTFCRSLAPALSLMTPLTDLASELRGHGGGSGPAA